MCKLDPLVCHIPPATFSRALSLPGYHLSTRSSHSSTGLRSAGVAAAVCMDLLLVHDAHGDSQCGLGKAYLVLQSMAYVSIHNKFPNALYGSKVSILPRAKMLLHKHVEAFNLVLFRCLQFLQKLLWRLLSIPLRIILRPPPKIGTSLLERMLRLPP